MKGQFKGCAAEVRKICPKAIYLHCANHSLNLAITHPCNVTPIRNCIGTIKVVVNFFRRSNKAGHILETMIKKIVPDAKQIRLLKFCDAMGRTPRLLASVFRSVPKYLFIFGRVRSNHDQSRRDSAPFITGFNKNV